MLDPTKSQRRELRKLAELAYDRELGIALEKLEAHFKRWRRGEISPHDLNELIHEHHDGVSRELWNFYNNKPDFTVPLAIAKGTIAENEVPPILRDCIPNR